MTRTAIRHTLSTLAAVAIISALAGPVLAQHNTLEPESFKINTPKAGAAAGLYGVGQLAQRSYENQVVKKNPNILATKKRGTKPNEFMNQMQWSNQQLHRSAPQKPKTPKGLATKTGPSQGSAQTGATTSPSYSFGGWSKDRY